MKKYNLFIDILQTLHVKHIEETTLQLFEQHPDKDNMYGLSMMLRAYGIETLGLQFENKEASLQKLEAPFVANVDHELVMVKELSSVSVTYIWNGNEISLSSSDFVKQWSGAVLGFEANDHSIEPNYYTKKKQKMINILTRNILILMAVCSWICLSVIYISLWTSIITPALFSLTGVTLCWLLVQKQMTGESRYGDKICSLLLHSNNCNSVLEMDISKFFGISLSSIGLGYFICSMLLLLDQKNLDCMLIINILAFPFTLWSIWTQKFNLKQWCALCLLVLACLWATFISLCLNHRFDPGSFNIIRLAGVGCLYIVSMLTVHFFVNNRVKAKEQAQLIYGYKRIKANEEVFCLLLHQQKSYPDARNVGLTIGNMEAQNCLTIVTNPHCNPCARLHPHIESLYKAVHNDMCIQFILTSFNKDLEPSSMLLIQQYQRLKNDNDYLTFLTEWYKHGEKNKESFYQKYALNTQDETMLQSLERQKQWMRDTGITTTPTILFNGWLIPEQYELEDLAYFIHTIV